MSKQKKDFWIRNFSVVIMVSLMILLVYLVMITTLPELMDLLKEGNLWKIRHYLKTQSTHEGLLCVGLLQVLQIFVIVISALPIQVASGIVFGAGQSFVVCTIGTILGMVVYYLLWRYLGHVLEKIMPLSEKEEGMLRRMMEQRMTPEYMLFLIGFLFFMPNGLIPILATKMKVSLGKFLLAITPGISFNVLICVTAGEKLLDEEWMALIGVLLLGFMIIAFFWKLHDVVTRRMEHKKLTRKHSFR